MKIAIYPGSFNPWHDGHHSILFQAVRIFDKVIVAYGKNPEKINHRGHPLNAPNFGKNLVEYKQFDGFLKDFVEKENACCIIRGLRNGQDFEYEKSQQYWNEDLGIKIPTLYIIADRNLTHISSSAIRQINKVGV